MKTPEQIAALAEKRAQTELGVIRVINSEYRRADESHLYPILGRFNVTDRAIRHVRAFMRDYGSLSALEYAYALDAEIGRIVNSEV